MFNIIQNNEIDCSNNNMEGKINKPFIDKQKFSPINPNEKSILSLIINKGKRRSSLNTADTLIIKPKTLDYNLEEIKKFDELNNSLSDISDFDLEEEKDENKSDFNSEEDNNDFEEEEIIIKNKKIINNKKNDLEYEIELDKEFEDIINSINICKN